MFFCEKCREKMKWPDSLARSCGPCEVCKEVALCYDVPSKYLPRQAEPDPATASHGYQHPASEK